MIITRILNKGSNSNNSHDRNDSHNSNDRGCLGVFLGFGVRLGT